MGFLQKLSKLILPPQKEDFNYWIKVKCSKCGEIIRTRVDLRNDLSLRFDDKGKKTYFCRKVLLGAGKQYCFQSVEVTLTFDANRNLIERTISGGEFLEE
jgi:phage FluMu protein Com